VGARISRLEEARAVTRRLRFELGREIRDARLAAGASLHAAAARVDMSHAQLSRIERGVLDELTVDQVSRACAAVGLQLWARAVPGAGPALDAPQLALIGRLRKELPSTVRVRTEVPIPLQGDRRAWDCVLGLDPDETPLEAETRLRDIQSLDRRHALKLRDSGMKVMVLLIADTAHNRRMLELYREDLRGSFPLDTRQVMAALRAGRTPPASGIVIL
jgi:transcriptional regulator with XRE-family HTH domain